MHAATKKKRVRLIRELTDAVLAWKNVSTYEGFEPAEKRLMRACRKLEHHMEMYGEKHPWEDDAR